MKSPNTPRKTMRTTPGTRPTTASDEGKESIPLLTISAIIRAATSSHDSVLYLIFRGRGTISQDVRFLRDKGSMLCGEPRASARMHRNQNTNIMLLLMAEYIVIIIRISLPIKRVCTFQGWRRNRMLLRHVSPFTVGQRKTAHRLADGSDIEQHREDRYSS